jgi:hypothetical protein
VTTTTKSPPRDFRSREKFTTEFRTTNNRAKQFTQRARAMSAASPTQAQAPTQEGNNAAPAPAAASSTSPNPASNGTTPAPSTGAATASSSSSTGQDDSLVCRWDQCKEPFTSAEALYVSC